MRSPFAALTCFIVIIARPLCGALDPTALVVSSNSLRTPFARYDALSRPLMVRTLSDFTAVRQEYLIHAYRNNNLSTRRALAAPRQVSSVSGETIGDYLLWQVRHTALPAGLMRKKVGFLST